ncbi:MAG: RDD family protein [Planctomycetaceae bacterium]|nr:RDD family protein [Planctomycetaceae bacterium]
MPIKVRCRACEAVLNVPEKAAGRVVLCKSCGGKVKVPVPAGSAPTGGNAGEPRRRRRPPAEETDSGDANSFGGDLFGGIDLNRAEDSRRKVCPACASPVHINDVECPKCKVTIATGVLSERQRLIKERKGPPPAEFYSKIWSDGGKFLKKHMNYAVLTAVIWSITLSMAGTCSYAYNWYIKGRTAELLESMKEANGVIEGDTLVINIEKGGNTTYDGKRYTAKSEAQTIRLPSPYLQPFRDPPAIFWLGMTIVFQLGFGGWGWILAVKIAQLTMEGQKKIKRFQFDFFATLTMGFRFYFWPVVLMAPLIWIIPLLAVTGGRNGQIGAGILASVLFLLPMLLFLPAAVVHTTQKYGYRAWLINWMARDFGKTIAPSLYIAGLNIVLVLLVPIILAGVGIALQARLLATALNAQSEVLGWLASNLVDMGDGSMRFLFYELPLTFGALFIIYALLCSLVSFPAVFMMRVIGLYGLYFKPDLSLVNEFPDNTPVGFGPRFLAFLVDYIIMIVLLIPASVLGYLGALMFVYYGYPELGQKLNNVVYAISALALWGIYFAKGESGAARATLGKWSLGLIVLRDDGKPLTPKQAFGRVASAFVTSITFYIGFIMCAFRSDRKAMHDLMSKSKVIWRSDETE